MSTFSENLLTIRKQRGLTRNDMATILGTTVQTYGAYENGRREPSFERLCKIAAALNISTDGLLGHQTPNKYDWLRVDGFYYSPSFGEDNLFYKYVYAEDNVDKNLMSRGLVFQTEEEAIAAAKKMLEALQEVK